MRYYLAMCAIMQNEGLYIEEWLKYHHAIGFEHFYLYENDSTDKTLEIAYNASKNLGGIATIVQYPGKVKQFSAYQTCLLHHRDDMRWLAFMDVDEFLVPIGGKLPDLMKDYERYVCLRIHWRLFGSSGARMWENKPVVERFTRREPGVNPHVKCIVDPQHTGACHTAHLFRHDPRTIVDENFKLLEELDPWPKDGTCNKFQINHYAVKSYDECMERRNRPRTDTGEIRKADEFFIAHDRNEAEDLKALEIWQGIQ